jgi:hypothetical protein
MKDQRGAYGFRLVYPASRDALRDLVAVDPSAPTVRVSWRLASTIVTHDHADEHRVSMGARGATSFYVEREPASITFDVPIDLSPDALVHPLGTVALAVLARWRGDVTLHAGAFVASSGAWAVLGERGSGKSSMLAVLAQRGYPVVADDLLAVLDGLAWAGPSCVDLRSDVAERIGSARDLGMIGGRARQRLSTPPAPGRTPLSGFFVLDWHDRPEVAIAPLSARERLQWLYRSEYIGLMGPASPEKILALAVLPAYRITRSREWSAVEEAVEAMLAVTADRSEPYSPARPLGGC